MMMIERGAKRTAKPDIFISHSSKDKKAALHLAKVLNFCSIDVWLDDWELEVGQSLTDEISKAMNESRYIAILITENYNKTVWTKTEYKKALSREQKEQRTVMLPLIIGEAVIPDFLEDKMYIDLRAKFFNGVVNLVGMIHSISRFRISEALNDSEPENVGDIWRLLQSIGFEPYVVLGNDDFQEMLKHGGHLIKEDYATFDPFELKNSGKVSNHVKALIGELI
ncbi:putative TIR domain-containing protein [Candidatus Nitrotoga sp. BS]|uniref:toll/interleukin-1 receptor domain-containing protein n=1 Tax=Candidatus Nitrotoga sp. BS TaxID=2890408 RepID=UPI001EF27F97|nr:toll/interleukin-1 receptor domain-containing protein [Candidatus Nitrotoga sp. BS]CAH1203095.1 putative TIR domain-containing protein [Candidatus Nitrotoga sp. BS]